jgi:LysR family glycine cleavage system transcriptional activator
VPDRLRRQQRNDVLMVSTTISLAAKWLVRHRGSFQEAHPDVEVRISTGTRLVDFRHEEIDVAIRYSRGQWPGLRADWLMAEDIFPVCSPSLPTAAKPLKIPADLAAHTLLHTETNRDEWTLWLTTAGLPTSLATQRSLTFGQRLMALQAAIDGLGIALGTTRIVETDLAARRLIAPFGSITRSAETGYYLVGPAETAVLPKIALFREWLMQVARREAVGQPQIA